MSEKKCLLIQPAEVSGYVIFEKDINDFGRAFPIKFAGSIDECLGYIWDYYDPRIATFNTEVINDKA